MKLAFIAIALSSIDSYPSSDSVPSLAALTARVTLTALAAGGEAVGRLPDGRVVFVPGSAPDELADVAIEEVRKGYVRALLRNIVRPSPHRVNPACVLATPGRCGGCPLMHIAAKAQQSAKQDWVLRAVRHSGARVLPLLTPTPPLAYRVRAKLGVTGGKLSFSLLRSNQRQVVSSCAVLSPQLARVLFGPADRLVSLIGDGGTLAALVGQHDGQTGVQLAVELGPAGRRSEVRDEVKRLWESGIIVGGIVGDEVIGCAALMLDDSFAPLFASADGFAQASAAGHTILPALLRDAVAHGFDSPPTVLELYAGSGNLTRAICDVASRVVAVEGEPRAAARLHALQKQLPRLQVHALAVEKALPLVLKSQPHFDVIVLDPPRGGARSIVSRLGGVKAKRIVYVSCDAMTLGRDLVELRKLGYQPQTVQPIDLMPQTAEVECIAVLDGP